LIALSEYLLSIYMDLLEDGSPPPLETKFWASPEPKASGPPRLIGSGFLAPESPKVSGPPNFREEYLFGSLERGRIEGKEN
jgi:hypothetical protein